MPKFKLISFDSTGTLLHVTKSVGYHYARVLARYFPGALSSTDLNQLEKDFNSSFKLNYKSVTKKYPNFGHGTIGAYQWWSNVVLYTFMDGNIGIKNYQYTYIFDEIYRDFRSSKCWGLFPEVGGVLQKIKDAGIRIIVVSDFDEGLPNILYEHKLYTPENKSNTIISSVYTSYEIGQTKPDSLSLILEQEGIGRASSVNDSISISECLHVGDSVDQDVAGAISAKITPVLVKRGNEKSVDDRGALTVSKLDELLPILEI